MGRRNPLNDALMYMAIAKVLCPDEPKPRPTVQVMDGETGEDECLPFDDLYPVRKSALDTTPCHYDWYDAMRGGPCSCPAPTPRVP